MHELLYSSVAAKEVNDDTLLEIIDVAQKFNKRHNITGLLVYHKREFLQILEGEKDLIFDLFGKISNDKRHTGVSLYYEGPISDRKFKNWYMGLVNLDTIDRSKIENFSDFLNKGFSCEITSEHLSDAQSLLLSIRDML